MKYDLNIVMTKVLRGLLFYDSGLWMYYLDDDRFEAGDSFSHQQVNEDFYQFIERTLHDVMIQEDEIAKERNDGYYPEVTINYALYLKVDFSKFEGRSLFTKKSNPSPPSKEQ